jgi:hypothetical protein
MNRKTNDTDLTMLGIMIIVFTIAFFTTLFAI